MRRGVHLCVQTSNMLQVNDVGELLTDANGQRGICDLVAVVVTGSCQLGWNKHTVWHNIDAAMSCDSACNHTSILQQYCFTHVSFDRAFGPASWGMLF